MKSLTANIKHALKQNLVAGVSLQLFAILLAVAYFNWSAALPVFNFFADLKASYGWRYSMVSTALFGGLIPFLVLAFTGNIGKNWRPILLFYVCYWAYKGVEVDWLYTWQGIWFGNDTQWSTLLKKTFVDQFVYGTFWAAPSMAIPYLWKECGFNFSVFAKKLDRDLFFIQIPTTLITNWLIWIPAVLVIYSMPPALQIPLFNLVLCFFVLLLTTISQKKAPTASNKN
jgi:hypothetical protein